MDISDAPPLSDSRFPEEEILVTPTPLQKTNDGFIDILARDITMASDSEETPPPKKRRIVDARTTTHAAASREEDDFLPESYLKRLKTMVYDKLMVVRVYEHDLEADYDPADSSPMKMSISSHLYHRLYSHQKVGVKFLYSLYINKIGGLLADEMGLGKTIQIISLINSICSLPSAASPEQIWNTRIKPILIVCPATLVGQWRKEFLEFDSFMRITILNSRLFGTYKHEKIIDRIRDIGGVFLSSFEFLRTHLKFFKEIDWFYEILDEGQKIRNPDAQITLAIKSLKTANRLLLSGSPIQNDLREFWSIFDFVQPGILGTLPIFMSHFGDPITASGMARVSESAQSRAQTSLAILKSIVAPHMIRRTKRQIHLTLNLPDKQEQIIICPLSLAQYQVYVDFLVEHDVEAAAIRRGTKTRSLWFISVLSKICNHPDLLLLRLDRSKWPSDFGNASRSGKLNLMMEILTTWISEQRKVLIFSQSVQMLDIIQLTIESVPYKFLRMDGHTPVNTRLNTVDEFNVNPEIPIMLLTTRVGGVGLNLVAASRVIIFDPDWNPTVDNQAQERAWRIGQEKDVVVYRLLCKGTIEEKIYKRQIFKLCLSDKILTNSNIQKVFSVRDFSELFKFPPAPKDFQVSSSRLRSLFVKAFSRDFTAGLLDTPVPRVLDNIKEIRSISASEPRVATLPEATLPEATLPEATLPEATLQAFSDEESEDDKSNKDDRANEEVPNILKLLFESDLVESVVDHKAAMAASANIRLIENYGTEMGPALTALRQSSANRRAFGFHIPTWTGKYGFAGKPIEAASQSQGCKWTFDELDKKFANCPSGWDYSKSLTVGERRIVERLYDFFYHTKDEGWMAETGSILLHFSGVAQTDSQKQLLKERLNIICTKDKQFMGPLRWVVKPEVREILDQKDRSKVAEVFEDVSIVRKDFTTQDDGWM